MLKTLIKKEILENILNYRFPLFFIICAVLFLASFYVNYLDYSNRVSDWSEQVRLSDDALKSSRPWDLISGSTPMKGFRAPSPLSIFAHGFESSLPRFYEFGMGGYKQGETSSGDESVLSIFGKFDLAFIIQMIISLIVLLFASDLVSGEKESGTLRGILSNSIPRDSLLMGKIFGGFFASWLPLIIALLCGIILLSLTPFPLFQAPVMARIIFVFVLTSVFVLIYFNIGIMISASSARARTSLAVILLAWIFLQLIVPKFSDMVAAVVYPIRTETVVSMQKSLITNTLEQEKAKLLGQQWEKIFGQGYQPTSQPGPPPKKAEWDVFKKETDGKYQENKIKRIRDIEDTYRREKQTQQSIAGKISLISPSASFTRILTDLCGTGEIDKDKYTEAVKAFQQTLDVQLYSHVDRTTLILPGGGTSSMSNIGDFPDLKSLPAFSIGKSTLSEVFGNNLGSLISLAFWLVAPFAVAYVRFLKYDVR